MVVRTRHPIFILASIAVFAGLSFTGPVFAFGDQPADGLPGWRAVSQVELEATRGKHLDEDFHFEATIGDNGNGGITINGAGNATITINGDGGDGGAGTNTISTGAFTDFSGLANVILNTGNGSIIQAGIAVTVNVYP